MKSNFENIISNEIVPNEECLYELELEGNFKDLGYNCDNSGYEKELLKILPENTLTLGYMCTCCDTWMSSNIQSLCTICSDSYEANLEKIKKGQENSLGIRVLDWIDYYEYKENNKLYIAFTTESLIDIEKIRNEFIVGDYIKSISINKVMANDNNIECQSPFKKSN